MRTEGPGAFPCSHPADLEGIARIQALHACLGREDHCPQWQAVHGEVWLNISAERRLQYLPDDRPQIRQQVERMMVEVRSCVQAEELIEGLLDLLPARVVMEDLMAGLRQRDNAAARANSLWLAAYAVRECGHKPAPPGDADTTKAAHDAIVAAVPRGRERDLVMATAQQVEIKVYSALDKGAISGNFDGWRKRALHTTKIDELRRRDPAAAKKPPAAGQDGTETPSQPPRPHPRNARTFSELAGRDPYGREGLLPAEVVRIRADDDPPDEVVIRREQLRALRLALTRTITEYATKTWKQPAEAQAKARLLLARLLEDKAYSQLAASDDARTYKLSAHAIELLVSRAKKVLKQDAELQQLHAALSDKAEPPAEGDPAGAT